MSSAVSVGRFLPVDSDELGDTGARIRARRKSLGLQAGRLAALAEVNREHLSAVENGHKRPTDEWVRRVELAMDEWARETGQEPTEPVEPATPAHGRMIKFTVEGVYGAKALVVEGPVENLAELEDMVDRVMRRLAGDNAPTDQ